MEDYEYIPSVVEIAKDIISMDRELLHLRKENKELKEEVQKYRDMVRRDIKSGEENIALMLKGLLGVEDSDK